MVGFVTLVATIAALIVLIPATPAQAVATVQITSGQSHTCALTTDGGAKCWGSRGSGQVGDGSSTSVALTPVDVIGLTSGVRAIAAGWTHTCAVTTDGAAKCWGDSNFGKLGTGNYVGSTTPVDVVGLGTGVSDITAGAQHTCALMAGGTVKCWGYGGALGNGSTADSNVPVDVAGLSNAVQISAGRIHSCAVTSFGGVKCWGANTSGQLGDGTTVDRSTPVDVVGLTAGVQSVATGANFSCALLVLGEVKCWGSNAAGTLGNGTTADNPLPGTVAGLSGATALTAGGFHACVIGDTDALFCWGYNSTGQVGDGTTTQRNTAVPIPALASGVLSVSGGYTHTCAATTSGAFCWGDNPAGQLGTGSTVDAYSPAQVVGFDPPVPTGDPDLVPPIVEGTPDRSPNGNGWYDSAVTIDWTSEDPDPSSGTPTDPPDTVASTEGTVTYQSDQSCDPSNNCATGSLELKIDLSDPGVTCNSAAFAVGQSGAQVTANVTDSVSGPVSATVSASASTGALGNYTASLTGTDLADRTTTVLCPYSVGYPRTSTTVTSVTNPTTFGQAIQFTATVTNIDTATTPTGRVQFTIDGGNFGTPVTLNAAGKATSVSYTSLGAGTHDVAAIYTSTNGTFVTSTGHVSQVVNAASTSLALSSSKNPGIWGQSTRFTANVTNTATSRVPAGTVQFRIDGNDFGGLLALDSKGGVTTPWINLVAGNHIVEAVFTGTNGNFLTSSRTITQVINANNTSTTITSSKNPSTVGQSVTFTASVKNVSFSTLVPTGSVQFKVDGADVGAPVVLSAGKATFTTAGLSKGTHTISAVFTSSSVNFQGSIGSMAKVQTVK